MLFLEGQSKSIIIQTFRETFKRPGQNEQAPLKVCSLLEGFFHVVDISFKFVVCSVPMCQDEIRGQGPALYFCDNENYTVHHKHGSN